MRREEKQKKFHEAILRTLYPSPSPPDSQDEEEEKMEPAISSEGAINLKLENSVDDFRESGSSACDDEDDGSQAEIQKLSRAKRKRVRKKKLKEDAFRRGNIIGPLLPLSEDGVGYIPNEPQGVRENAVDDQVASIDKPGNEHGGCSRRKKMKQRRIAKRLAKEGLKSTETEDTDKDKT